MKKTSKLFLATSMALILAACGSTNTNEEDLTSDNEQTEQAEDIENIEEARSTEETARNESDAADEEVNEDDMASIPEEEIADTETIFDYENYEELAGQDYFEPAEYNSHLVTDNPETRIFIFEKDGQQVYKTIFIKKMKGLKVIDLENDKLLMNEVIN